MRAAKISVWPGKLMPAACRASLLSGAVETAATWPASAASIARSTYVKPARPVAALDDARLNGVGGERSQIENRSADRLWPIRLATVALRNDRRAQRQLRRFGNAPQNGRIAKHDRHALAADRLIGQQMQADLRPDAGRVAHRDGNSWPFASIIGSVYRFGPLIAKSLLQSRLQPAISTAKSLPPPLAFCHTRPTPAAGTLRPLSPALSLAGTASL